jgi:Gas vesicle protein K
VSRHRADVPPDSRDPLDLDGSPPHDPLQRLGLLPQRLETDAESVQRDLMRLVLTIVELVRQLMEKQALRRLDDGDLTDEQIEGLGSGLMQLSQAMTELRERFGLSQEDLNLDLGPLGRLLGD